MSCALLDANVLIALNFSDHPGELGIECGQSRHTACAVGSGW